jgi:hypothetical protein
MKDMSKIPQNMGRVQKVRSNHAYQTCRWREQAAPAQWCLRSREGYIRHIVSSHSLFLSSSFCLEINVKIENPASCEIRSVIIFLNAKNVCPAEIYRQVCEVYGENAMSDGMVTWCRMFTEGRTNVHNDDWNLPLLHPFLVQIFSLEPCSQTP